MLCSAVRVSNKHTLSFTDEELPGPRERTVHQHSAVIRPEGRRDGGRTRVPPLHARRVGAVAVAVAVAEPSESDAPPHGPTAHGPTAQQSGTDQGHVGGGRASQSNSNSNSDSTPHAHSTALHAACVSVM